MIYCANIKTLRCNAEEIKDAIGFMVSDNLVKECCVDWKLDINSMVLTNSKEYGIL